MKKNKSPMKAIVITTLCTIVLISIIVAVVNMQRDEAKSFKGHPFLKEQPTIGNANAPISIVEFGDFKCPACKAWGEQIYPMLKKDYIDIGKVKFSYVNVLFHGEESKLAALAAESIWKQDQQAYWIFHKELFNAQPSVDHDGPWITPEKVLEVARTYSPAIDLEQLRTDMANQKTLPEVNKDDELVKQYGISQTPSIMINGVMLTDPYDYEKITKRIDNELAERQ